MVTSMSQKHNFTKSFAGDNNTNANNETGINHNRFILHGDANHALMAATLWMLAGITTIIVVMCIKFGAFVLVGAAVSLALLLAVTVGCVTFIAISTTVRHGSRCTRLSGRVRIETSHGRSSCSLLLVAPGFRVG